MEASRECVTTIELRLDPRALENPDADLRYVIPEMIEERSGGMICSDGYDYEGEAPVMVMFFSAHDSAAAVALIKDVLDSEVVLGNHLRGKYQLDAGPSSPGSPCR